MTCRVKSMSWILSLSLSVGVTLTLAPAICDAEPDKNTALLTIDAVEDLIRTHNIQSVEEFLPLLPETRHFIGAPELQTMKPTAVLINTGRGPLVDEAALVAALRDRTIWGAGLDVFEQEPLLAPGLAGLENVVIVPHTASATFGTRLAMGRVAVDNVLSVLAGGRPQTCVNPAVLG